MVEPLEGVILEGTHADAAHETTQSDVQQVDVIQEFVTACDQHVKAKTGKSMNELGVDPISLITAILAILAQMCPKPAAQLQQEAAANKPEAIQAITSATRMALREQHPGVFLVYARCHGKEIAESVRANLAKSTETKIQAGLAYCAV